jgi:hypothetical protein
MRLKKGSWVAIFGFLRSPRWNRQICASGSANPNFRGGNHTSALPSTFLFITLRLFPIACFSLFAGRYISWFTHFGKSPPVLARGVNNSSLGPEVEIKAEEAAQMFIWGTVIEVLMVIYFTTAHWDIKYRLLLCLFGFAVAWVLQIISRKRNAICCLPDSRNPTLVLHIVLSLMNRNSTFKGRQGLYILFSVWYLITDWLVTAIFLLTANGNPIGAATVFALSVLVGKYWPIPFISIPLFVYIVFLPYKPWSEQKLAW